MQFMINDFRHNEGSAIDKTKVVTLLTYTK